MENPEFADFTYHAFVVVGVVFATWLLIALLVKVRLIRILMLVRYMRFVETGVLALWGGVIVANIAVLASALSLHLLHARPFYEVRLSGHRQSRNQHDPWGHAGDYTTGALFLRRKGLHICDD